MGKLVRDWQTCAVPGQRMSDNLMLLRDLIFHMQANNRLLAVISMDLEKAYDKVSHVFLFQCLKHLGIPEHVTKILKSLYTVITS